ncbi:hypothetical protein BJ684DRAFT_21662, partial [Piptocephalis cylindrospora]
SLPVPDDMVKRLKNKVDELIKVPYSAPEAWKNWVSLREAVTEGRPDWAYHRYSEDQLRYHYTKDRQVILRAVQSLSQKD